VEAIIDLFAGDTLIAGIALFSSFSKAVEGFGELESYPLLSDAFISPKEVTVGQRVFLDRPLQEFNGLGMPENIFKRHDLSLKGVVSSEF
jgi:hypothetical protein